MRQTQTLQNLDSLRKAINGDPLSFMGMASSLFAQNHAGKVLEEDGKNLAIARLIQWQEENFAQLQFISAEDPYNTNLSAVIEALLQEAGAWGLDRVMGDLPVSSLYLSLFRKANFYIWASQTIYSFEPAQIKPSDTSDWQTWTSKDYAGMTALYKSLVPARIRAYEPMTRSKVLGKVLLDERGKVMAYVDLDHGVKGVWAQPFFLPEANHTAVFEDLLSLLFAEYSRPVSIGVRSYQPWLRATLNKLDAQIGEEHALIVRHLAVRDRAPEAVKERIFEQGKVEGGVYTINTREK